MPKALMPDADGAGAKQPQATFHAARRGGGGGRCVLVDDTAANVGAVVAEAVVAGAVFAGAVFAEGLVAGWQAVLWPAGRSLWRTVAAMDVRERQNAGRNGPALIGW